MAKYITTDSELTSIANVIRSKTNSSGSISYPEGFVEKIQSITTVGTDTTDANATANDIVESKTAYVNGYKIIGNIPENDSDDVTVSSNTVSVPVGCYRDAVSKTVGTALAATTYNTSASDQTITSGKYLSGDQTIRAVTTSNLSAGNIKSGVTVKVGDAADDDRIAGIAGTFTSDATAAAGDILYNKTAYVNGSKVTGSIASKTSTDVSVSTNTVSIPAGYYSSAVSKTVGTALAATTYNTSTSNQTIASGKYLSGNQTIRAVTTSNLSAGNIKSGVTVKVGDAADDDRIAGIAGTFTSDATAASGDILYNKTAYVNGSKVTGSIASKTSTDVSVSTNTVSIPAGYYSSAVSKTVGTALAATTYNTSTSDQTIAAGKYLSGAQTIRAVTTSNIDAANIKSGVIVKVGDSQNPARIAGVIGQYRGTIASSSSNVDVKNDSAVTISANGSNSVLASFDIPDTIYSIAGSTNYRLTMAAFTANTTVLGSKMAIMSIGISYVNRKANIVLKNFDTSAKTIAAGSVICAITLCGLSAS